MTSDQIAKFLIKQKVPAELAGYYAACFLEYQECNENIQRNGLVVTHPRTAAIVNNPYVSVREKCEKRLFTLRRQIGKDAAEALWSEWSKA